jgi:Protein of unknown function (DUF3500)
MQQLTHAHGDTTPTGTLERAEAAGHPTGAGAPTAFDSRPWANRMRAAADALLSNLTREQLARAQFAFEDEAERRDWDFIPKYRPRGLPLREMTDRQQVLAQQLLASALSLPGYTQAVSIMGFENVLRELNKDRMGLVASEVRHPGKYLFSFFGEPHAEQTWAWRMVGHHVALNYTIVDGTYVAPTPLLFGAEPAEFGVFKPLKDDEDRGFDLLYALDPEQRRRAIIHDVAPPDFVTRVVTKLGDEELPGDHELGFDHYVISDHDREMLKWVRHEAKGLPGSDMAPAQRDRLRGLIAGYLDRLPAEAAAKHLERCQGLERFAFAWAGRPERGKPHYYRIQGPGFLVEFENAQVGGGLPGEGNHIHTVWRDPDNDFGDDLLMRHYQQEHLPYVVTRTQSSRPRRESA